MKTNYFQTSAFLEKTRHSNQSNLLKEIFHVFLHNSDCMILEP